MARLKAYLKSKLRRCRCRMSRGKFVYELKESWAAILPLGLGMVSAYAWNLALQNAFDKMTGDEGSTWTAFGFAILITLISVLTVEALFKFKTLGVFGMAKEVVVSLFILFKVAFSLCTALAWTSFFNRSFRTCCDSKPGLLLLYAALLTAFACLCIVGVRRLQMKSSGSNWKWPIKRLIHGLVLIAGLVLLFMCGLAWNDVVQAAFSDLDGETFGPRLGFAIFCMVLAIAGTVLCTVIRDRGCCGVRKEIATTLYKLFQGTFAALAAFAWSDAFVALFIAIGGQDETDLASLQTKPTGAEVGLAFGYAFLVTPFCILLVFSARRF